MNPRASLSLKLKEHAPSSFLSGHQACPREINLDLKSPALCDVSPDVALIIGVGYSQIAELSLEEAESLVAFVQSAITSTKRELAQRKDPAHGGGAKRT